MKQWINKNRSRLLIIFVLVSIFAVSIAVRYKHFGHPLNRHHEWLTAHSLIIMDLWEQKGIANCYFSPIYSYPNKGDVNDFALSALHDHKGDSYYVSYGPFAFILPYTLFSISGIPINQHSLIGFNLLVHFLTALFLYLLVLKLSNKKFSEFSVAALVVFMTYVFSAGTLWFHSNVYFSEILAQFFLASGLYVFYLLVQEKASKRKTVIWYGVICFFTVYTDWLGLLFVFFTGIYLFISVFKNKVFLKAFVIGFFTGLAALGLMIFQYSQIAGYEKLKEVSVNKFILRNGGVLTNDIVDVSASIKNPETFGLIKDYFDTNFLNVINSFAFVVPAFVLLMCWRRKYFLIKQQLYTILIAALIVLTHNFLFYNFTIVHDFSILKTAYLLILLLGLMVSRIELYSTKNRYAHIGSTALILFFFTVKAYESCIKYDAVNDLSKVVAVYKDLGEAINKFAYDDEKVYSNVFPGPHVNYYAKRNNSYDMDGSLSRSWAGWNKGRSSFFKIEAGKCVSVTHYVANGDSTLIKLKHDK